MAKKKKGVIITSICSLLVGAAVIAEVVIGGDTGSKESYASVAEVRDMKENRMLYWTETNRRLQRRR